MLTRTAQTCLKQQRLMSRRCSETAVYFSEHSFKFVPANFLRDHMEVGACGDGVQSLLLLASGS